ncbi:hypothetical protein VP01_9877g1 [Puccinia sorghi]|uniref:Uncharacterized protein n=1 Tax=Puccinia sorghi TaxID=27349 RepID=A0A0L6U5H9_9BASI|nr:hypothetical protein VP01_9877g1 [Puccinia sorghi]
MSEEAWSVEQLNYLATNGCMGYDPMIQQEVLIMSMPLCFTADSPMAAAVTNNPHPGRANNSCRICHLQVDFAQEKHDTQFIQTFFAYTRFMEDIGRKYTR